MRVGLAIIWGSLECFEEVIESCLLLKDSLVARDFTPLKKAGVVSCPLVLSENFRGPPFLRAFFLRSLKEESGPN